MKRRVARFVCAIMLCAGGLAYAAEVDPEHQFTARIIAVLDGDTVLIRRDGSMIKIRLADIDAPEHAQPFGVPSRQSLSGMVLGRQVNVARRAIDQYGRMVAHLEVEGMDVSAEQIKRGMAWYSGFRRVPALSAMHNEARSAGIGLWSESNPTAPWLWRKQYPGVVPALQDPTPSSIDELERSVPDALDCAQKKYCSDMSSCAEARYYLSQCNVMSLDADGDGVPCEMLCVPGQN